MVKRVGCVGGSEKPLAAWRLGTSCCAQELLDALQLELVGTCVGDHRVLETLGNSYSSLVVSKRVLQIDFVICGVNLFDTESQ